jgi:hypothetical protein
VYSINAVPSSSAAKRLIKFRALRIRYSCPLECFDVDRPPNTVKVVPLYFDFSQRAHRDGEDYPNKHR